jgi:L-glutamine-phosphate cytidylyltransferase
LAAGEGKRLRPLTDDTPKCMVKLLGKSLLERQIATYHSCGVDDITVVTGYKNNKINFDGINVVQNVKFDTTNMVETLFCARQNISHSTIISYGDIIFQKNILEELVKSTHDISVVIDLDWKKYWELRFDNPLDDAESLIIDSNGFITDIGQKTQDLSNIQAQYIGLMKFQNNGIKNLLNFYDKTKNNSTKVNPLNPNIPFEKSYLTDLLQGLIKSGYKIKAIPIRNGWLELDSMNDYNIYEEKFSHDELSVFFQD